MQGGGGPLLTGTIEESQAFNCHFEQRELAESQSENVKQNCHAELVSASIQHCVLPVTPDRFRNKFGMTLAEPVLQLNLCDCTTKKVSVGRKVFVIASGHRPRGYPVEDTASLPGSPQASPS